MRKGHVVIAVALAAACIGLVRYWLAADGNAAAAMVPANRGQQLATSRSQLLDAIDRLEARLRTTPTDEAAAVELADVLLRQARVSGDTALPKRAEAVLRGVIAATDGYGARRMLGAVYLAQHRFREAMEAGRRAQALQPADYWNYGVIGDAAIELGDYDTGFKAFDRMAALRPNAASYARIAYARELAGDLDGALGAMRMAAEATSAHDPEGQAWAWAQIGALQFQRGALIESRRAYERAAFLFPRHPYALNGLARVSAAEGHHEQALAQYRALYETAATPELAAHIGDLLNLTGRRADAERMWAEAERLERDGWAHEHPQPAALSRLLSERGLKADVALRLAKDAASERDDVFTNDALAWALYRNGRFEEAWAASERALRLGTRDGRVLYHAAAIAAARGRPAEARRLAERALAGNSSFDLIAARGAGTLLASIPTAVTASR